MELAKIDLENDEANTPLTRARLEAAIPELFAKLDGRLGERDEERERYNRSIGYQVLGVLLMGAGCTLTEEMREKLVAGSTNCGEYKMASLTKEKVRDRLVEVGSTEDEIVSCLRAYDGERLRGRKAAIDGLVANLREYDIAGGTQLHVESPSLFDKMAEVLGA
ncbi:hypothetical protein [Variovorax sp. PBL-H6]|uniref:hypothetical protein n=1 Tax=Variovorax sp. PBL-H6 TaxID=434009 RepID=UPI0013A590FF|nr:hypothetical protein [Variovorax sp. PBL-H6]